MTSSSGEISSRRPPGCETTRYRAARVFDTAWRSASSSPPPHAEIRRRHKPGHDDQAAAHGGILTSQPRENGR
jgi:hypothetical protein